MISAVELIGELDGTSYRDKAASSECAYHVTELNRDERGITRRDFLEALPFLIAGLIAYFIYRQTKYETIQMAKIFPRDEEYKAHGISFNYLDLMEIEEEGLFGMDKANYFAGLAHGRFVEQDLFEIVNVAWSKIDKPPNLDVFVPRIETAVQRIVGKEGIEGFNKKRVGKARTNSDTNLVYMEYELTGNDIFQVKGLNSIRGVKGVSYSDYSGRMLDVDLVTNLGDPFTIFRMYFESLRESSFNA